MRTRVAMEKEKLADRLAKFTAQHKINSKGSLCVVLVATRTARNKARLTVPRTSLRLKVVRWPGLGARQCKKSSQTTA